MLTLILSVVVVSFLFYIVWKGIKRFAKWFGDIPVDKLFDKD